MTPTRCALCDRLLMGSPPPATADVANPEALVLCALCEASSEDDRRQRRSQIMVRMLDDVHQRHRRAS